MAIARGAARFKALVGRGLLTAAITLGVFAASACKGRVDQCNAFVDEANAGQSSYVGLEAAVGNPDALAKRADALEGSAKRLRDIPLADEKLVGMRDRYVTLTDQYVIGLRKLVTAPKDDSAAAFAIEQELDVTADKQQKLIQEINGYCAGH